MDTLFFTLVSLVVLIYSAILHEIAHGLVAERFGDPTARLLGRISLDPRRHIDLYMTILLPLLLILSHSSVIFGGAKPVPVDPFNLRDGRKDIAIVSLAGPLTNLFLAICGTILFKLFFHETSFWAVLSSSFTITSLFDVISKILVQIISINILLALFNLLPIPPLDGSKVFALLLPAREANLYLSLGNMGAFFVLFLLLFPLPGFSLMDIISNLYVFTLQHLLGL